MLLSTFSIRALGQEHTTGTPNYILRNQDFQDRRQTTGVSSFSKAYLQAFESKHIKNRHSKAESQWIPKGPFGKEDLAGIGRVNTMQIHPSDTNTWFICVAQGGLWKTKNAGKSWTSVSGDLPILRTSYLAIHPTKPDTMYLAMGDFAYLGHNLQANESKRNSHYGIGVYKTTDGGTSWKPTGLSFAQTDFEGSLIAKVFINHSNPDQVIAVGQTGAYVSDNGGDTWIRTHDKLFWDLEKHPDNDSTLFATTGYVHSYGLGEVSILKSTDFGKTWKAAVTPLPKTKSVQRVEIAVAPSDPDYIYALACDTVGGFYGFYRSTDGGLNFSKRVDHNSYPVNILNHSLDSEMGGQGRYDLAICVDRDDKEKVLVGGINMWQTTNGGMNFKPVTYWLLNYYDLSLHADIHEIIQHPSNNSIFACHDGGLSRSFKIDPNEIYEMADEYMANTEWTNYTNGLNVTSFYRLSVNQKNGQEMMAGAQDNSTVYTADSVYFNVSGGDGMESVFADDFFYRYTSSQNGRINAYLYDGFFSYEGTINPPNGEYGEWTTPFVWANGKLYILYGNLYEAQGSFRGKRLSNFSDVSGRGYPRPGTALAIEKTDASRIYLATRGYKSENVSNAIWTSSDQGKTWQNIGSGLPDSLYPSYIEMNQNAPDEVWITFSGFDAHAKVFHSTNGGKKWENITLDLPNIPVNCIAHQNDGSNYIYIGTDLGVFYLKPDSSSWVPYSTGLPPVIVSELEVDTVDKSLVAATFGRGLWEVDLLPYDDDNVGYTKISVPVPQMNIYPNPVGQKLEVSIDFKNTGTYVLKVIDITGKEVMHKNVIANGSPLELSFDVSDVLAGEYFLILSNGYRRSVRSFIKK